MNSVDKVVQREAYQIYRKRLREGRLGDHKSDWFEARKLIGLKEEDV
jgi:hypothetical protein